MLIMVLIIVSLIGCQQSFKRRARSANWDEKEKLAFVSIVKSLLPILEDKNKTVVCNKKKDEAWIEIQKRMNYIGYKRDAYRLREQWLRMKAQAKKNVKNYNKLIDEGRADVSPPTSIDCMIEEIVPQEFAEDEDGVDEPDVEDLHPAATIEFNVKVNEMGETTNGHSGGIHEGETTDTADGSECASSEMKDESKRRANDPLHNTNIDGSGRLEKERPSLRHMTSFEFAILELKRMKTEAAMRHSAELHRIRLDAALWERKFWEAKVIRLQGFRL